jgi:hypothetical protein
MTHLKFLIKKNFCYLSHGSHKGPNPNQTRCSTDVARLRANDLEGRRYIGLLQRITAIVDATGFFILKLKILKIFFAQIPYTMMKFACFEKTVEFLYKNVVPKPRADCSKSEQLLVTFVAGYIAGVFCAIVSHPADTVVSKLNQDAGASAIGILKKLGPVGELLCALLCN